MNPEVRRAECLRDPENAFQPDPRSESFVMFTEEGGYRPKTLDDHHQSISRWVLNETVPEEIIIQFETAKNLYLYAWFVYRFYPVAQSQVYACLELALHRRMEQEMAGANRKKRKYGFGLRNYLKYAVEKGYIRNEDFEVWRRTTLERAKERHLIEAIEEMQRLGLDKIEVDDSKVEITEEDRDYDYLAILLETIPYLRNHFAHGSTTLHNQVLGTFQVVSAIVNAVYARTADEGK